MNHAVSFICHRQLNDGQVAICAECCGDQSTHSWLTMAAEVVNDPARRQEAIDFHANRVATLHQSMLTALATLPSIIGSVTQVTIPDGTPVDPVAPAPTPPDSQPVAA